MPRISRAVFPGVAHHITQRGVDRQQVFFSDRDRSVYLQLVERAAGHFGVALIGYCLMPNHVHWIVVPESASSLAKAFGRAHGRYAQYSNSLLQRTGHFWQNRFFSCALDEAHLWAALRYVERNPVRAGIRPTPESWRWSSAAVHGGWSTTPKWLDLALWRERFTGRQWRKYVAANSFGEAEMMLRVNTYSGRPLGSRGFVERMEAELGRVLQPKKRGRPARSEIAQATVAGGGQGILSPGG